MSKLFPRGVNFFTENTCFVAPEAACGRAEGPAGSASLRPRALRFAPPARAPPRAQVCRRYLSRRSNTTSEGLTHHLGRSNSVPTSGSVFGTVSARFWRELVSFGLSAMQCLGVRRQFEPRVRCHTCTRRSGPDKRNSIEIFGQACVWRVRTLPSSIPRACSY